MADIFISYANEDRDTAGHVAQVLETAGFSVWWDRRIPAGRTWRAVLEEALQGMRCLIVLWSENSIKSPWVIEEAEEARRLEKIMLPVLIQKIDPPVGFRAIQAANLIGWDGTADAPAMKLLVTDLKSLLGEARVRPGDNLGPERPIDTGADDHQPLGALRRWFIRHWKTLVGGCAAVALLLLVLRILQPVPEPSDAPAKKPPNQASPARQLTGIAIAGAWRELKPAETVELKLQGNYSDGTSGEIAESIKWTSSDSRVASVDGYGRVKALQPGAAEITARYGALVSPPWAASVMAGQNVVKDLPSIKLVKLSVTPARKELFANERVALRVVGRYSDQSEKTVARELQWQVSDPNVVSVTPDGQLRGLRPGRVELFARAGDIESAPVAIVVKELAKKPQVETPAVKTGSESRALTPPPAEPARPRIGPYVARARSLRDQGQYGAALAELQKAAALDPSNPEVAKEIDQTRKACAAEKNLGQRIDC